MLPKKLSFSLHNVQKCELRSETFHISAPSGRARCLSWDDLKFISSLLPVSLLHNFTTFFTRFGRGDRVLWMPRGEGEQHWQPKNSRYSLQPFFFFQSKAQSSLLLGESNCFQSSLIKHVSKANLVSLFQTPANGLIINLVPFLIANLVSQGLHKGDIRGQAGSQSVFQQTWSKGVSLVSHLITFYPEFLKELWFPRAGQV